MNKMPESWKEITISQFQKIYPIIKSDDYDSTIDKYLDIAAILCSRSISDIPITEINKLSFLLNIEAIPKQRPAYVQHKGKLYKPIYDISKLSGGQYIDLSTYTSDADTLIKNLHYVIAIMCEERSLFVFKKKYTPDNVKRRAEIFKELPISIAYPMAVFFCTYSDNLTHSISGYLKRVVKTTMQISAAT